MAGSNEVELKLTLNEAEFKKSASNTSQLLGKLEDDANDVNKALDNTFDTTEINKANKAIEDLTKEVNDLKKRLKDTDKEGKKTTKGIDSGFRKAGRSVRRFSQGLRGAFARSGIGIFLIAIGSIISGFGDLKNTVLDSLGAVGTFFRSAIDLGRDFLNIITFGLVSSTEQLASTLEANTTLIRNANENLLLEAQSIAIERAKIEAEIAGASAEEILAIQQEAADKEIELIKKKDEDIFRQIAARGGTIAVLEAKIAKERNDGRRAELEDELAQEEKKLLELRKSREELRLAESKANLDSLKRVRDFNENLEKEREKARSEARKAREEARKRREKEEAEARKAEEKRLADELKLRLAFLVDEQTAREIKLQNEAQVNKELARQTIQDATTLNIILNEIEKKKNQDIQKLRDEASDKEKQRQQKELQDQLTNAQNALENELQLEQAKLREQQVLQRQQFSSVERTENDIALFEAQQQRDREEQSLRFEKRRLELILEFGALRTEAEIQTTKQLIAALDAELNELLQKPLTEGQEDPQGGGFLQKLLGLDDEQLKALQDATKIAIGEVNKLLDTRLNALNEEVNARTERLGQLNTLLAAETALLQAGEAANVQGVKDQIAQEEKAREEALKKQRSAAIAKQTLDTVTQTSSLITASAQIFQSLSAIPFVGIPLAIGTIATMFAAFAAAQATAFSSIQPVSLYTGGRIMQGEKDTNGGNGLRIEGTNARVGRGEWIVNADTSEKQNDFIRELNTGKFDDVDFMAMLGDGSMKKISLIERGTKKAINRKTQANLAKMYAREIGKQTSVLSKGLDDLYQKPQFIPTDKGFIERSIDKRGNISTKKINLKQ